jgi:hypothetical protein
LQTSLNQPVIYLQIQTPSGQSVIYLQILQSQNFRKELANLAKLYTENTKYSSKDNNFNYKLIIFQDFCKKAALFQQVFAQAYSTILYSLALDYYYTNCKNILYIIFFKEIYYTTCNYFEGAKYKYNMLRLRYSPVPARKCTCRHTAARDYSSIYISLRRVLFSPLSFLIFRFLYLEPTNTT